MISKLEPDALGGENWGITSVRGHKHAKRILMQNGPGKDASEWSLSL